MTLWLTATRSSGEPFAVVAAGEGDEQCSEWKSGGGWFWGGKAGGWRLGNEALRAQVIADEPTVEIVDVQVAVGVAGRAAEAAVAELPDAKVGPVDDGVA